MSIFLCGCINALLSCAMPFRLSLFFAVLSVICSRIKGVMPEARAGHISGVTSNHDFLALLEKLATAFTPLADMELKSKEGRRRLCEFCSSCCNQEMPEATSFWTMPCLTTLTPHVNEEVLTSWTSLTAANSKGVTLLDYLKKISPHVRNTLGLCSSAAQ